MAGRRASRQGNQPIADNVPIDSIVTFTSLGGTPVAIGPCLQPVVGGVIL